MEGAEQRGLGYVFKLKQSMNVKRLIAKLLGNDHWVDAGEKWQGLDTELQLSGWSRKTTSSGVATAAAGGRE